MLALSFCVSIYGKERLLIQPPTGLERTRKIPTFLASTMAEDMVRWLKQPFSPCRLCESSVVQTKAMNTCGLEEKGHRKDKANPQLRARESSRKVTFSRLSHQTSSEMLCTHTRSCILSLLQQSWKPKDRNKTSSAGKIELWCLLCSAVFIGTQTSTQLSKYQPSRQDPEHYKNLLQNNSFTVASPTFLPPPRGN